MAVLQFTIRVNDDGTAVVEKFTKGVGDSAKKAERSAGRMTKAFAGVRRGLGGISKAVFSLRGLLIGLGTGAAIRGIVRAAQTQEDAISRVNAALRSSGDFSQAASRRLQEFAAQMQQVSLFGDEVILSQIALAKAFGFSNEKVEDAIRAAVNLSAAAGIELTEAVRRVGRTISGSTADVQKFAPEIANLTKEQLAAGDAATILAQALRGQATAQTRTFSGVVIQANNAIGDFVETLGLSITKSIAVREAIRDLTGGFTVLSQESAGAADSFASFIPSGRFVVQVSFVIRRSLELLNLAFLFLARGGASAINFLTEGFAGARVVFATVGVFIQTVLAGIVNGLKNTVIEVLNFVRVQARQLGAVLASVRGTKALREELGELRVSAAKAAIDLERQTTNTSALDAATRKENEALSDFNVTLASNAERVDAGNQLIEESKNRIIELSREQDAAVKSLDALAIANVKAANATKDLNEKQKASVDIAKSVSAEIQANLILAQEGIVSFFAFSNQETSKQFQTLISTNQQAFAQINALTAQAADFEKQSAADKASIIVGITGAFFGTLLALTASGSRKEFEFFKAFSIAEALVAAGLAITKAFTAGPILGPILAATIAGQTALQIRQIKSVQFGGAGAAPTAAAGGGGAAAFPAAAAPIVPEAPITAAPAPTPTQITISVSGFIGDEAELASALGEIITEAQGDDVEFQLS